MSGSRKVVNPYKIINGVMSYVDPVDYEKEKSIIDPDLVIRSTKEGEVVMAATHLLSVMKPGADLHLNEVPLCDAKSTESKKELDPVEKLPLSSVEVDVQARWYSPEKKAANNDNNANIFGQYGCFELVNPLNNLEIPAVDLENVSDEDLKPYQATRLTPEHDSYLHFNTSSQNLYFVVYDYSKNYLPEYALKQDLGGGWFIEKHDFPQVFKPMNPDCGGAVLLGRLISQDQATGVGNYKFVSIKMKYPESLAIASDVIHGNSSFSGPYIISSTTVAKASIVVMRTHKGEMQSVTQPSYQNPNRLFQQKAPVGSDVENAAAATTLPENDEQFSQQPVVNQEVSARRFCTLL